MRDFSKEKQMLLGFAQKALIRMQFERIRTLVLLGFAKKIQLVTRFCQNNFDVYWQLLGIAKLEDASY